MSRCRRYGSHGSDGGCSVTGRDLLRLVDRYAMECAASELAGSRNAPATQMKRLQGKQTATRDQIAKAIGALSAQGDTP